MLLGKSIIFMFIFSFIIQYFLMSLIMTNNNSNIRNSLGKLYLSLIMAFMMAIVEVIMHDTQHHHLHISYKYYIILGLLLGILIYFYRTQYLIDDNNYVKEMIEHHSMALFTSDRIIKKTKNKEVYNLATNIIKSQQEEIDLMNKLV